ncbi:MAG: hypothetical protein H6717_09950 [Polyangiaceae bacterium]|nr:hypothetical protein [Polyangiaceae bacterium]
MTKKWIGLPLALAAVASPACQCSSTPDAVKETDAGHDSSTWDAPKWPLPDSSYVPPETGTGGQDSGSTLPDGSAEAPYAWMFDPDAWTPVASIPECDVREADVSKLEWPGFQWTACGSGCLEADVVGGSKFHGARENGASARVEGGRLLAFLTVGVRFPPSSEVLEVVDIEAGKLMSAVVEHGDDCSTQFLGRFATRGLKIVPAGASHFYIGLAGTQLGQAAAWPLPALVGDQAPFDFDGGWGVLSGLAAVKLTTDFASSSALTTVYSSPGYQTDVIGYGPAVAWVDWQVPHRVLRGWTKQGGTRVLVQAPYHVVDVALSAQRIVWLGATGTSLVENGYETSALYWSPNALDPDNIVPSTGIPLPIHSDPGLFATAGPWAAVKHCVALGDCETLIVNLDTKAVWKLAHRPGREATVLGMSDKTLLLAEAPYPPGEIGDLLFDRLLRYDLTKLQSFATPQ